jgi:putative DNA primase/helicase
MNDTNSTNNAVITNDTNLALITSIVEGVKAGIAEGLRPRDKKDTGPKHDQLALEFLADLGKDTVYHQGFWYVYDGTCYRYDSELSLKVRKWLVSKRYQCNNHVVSNVVNDLYAIRSKFASSHPAMPFYVGEDPFPKNVMAFRNGLLDIDAYLAGEPNALRPHTPNWISTFSLPYDFDPNATCPLWQDKLVEAFGSKEDSRYTLLQEWFGYTMTPDISLHKMLVKCGVPRAFKGTSDRIHQAMLGDDNTIGYSLHSLVRDFGLRRLVGKYVAFVGEVELARCNDKARICEVLKGITGGDPQSVESKGVNEVPSIILPTRFSISCNEKPRFIDATGALAARMLYIKFDVSFKGREDTKLLSKLLPELPGIAVWALEGLRRLRSNGRFTETETQKEMVKQFRRTTDAYAFAQDCLQVERERCPANIEGIRLADTPQKMTAPSLRTIYAKWLEETGKEPLRGNMLEDNLQDMFPDITSDRVDVTDHGVRKKLRVYYGIGPTPDYTPPGSPS